MFSREAEGNLACCSIIVVAWICLYHLQAFHLRLIMLQSVASNKPGPETGLVVTELTGVLQPIVCSRIRAQPLHGLQDVSEFG